MRPVNKGTDLGEFKPYGNAQQPLVDKIGEFCSYCERWVSSGIHIEHKKPKDKYPSLEFEWDNFLLACTNCNSAKGSRRLNLNDYVWPDYDNTLRAFIYRIDGVIVPNATFSANINQKIEKTWKLVGLNRHPHTAAHPAIRKPSPKDRRWIHRRDIWNLATRKKQSLSVLDTPERREDLVDLAFQRGMFSIWFTVFSNDKDMRERLILAFEGTDTESFDINFLPIQRVGGAI